MTASTRFAIVGAAGAVLAAGMMMGAAKSFADDRISLDYDFYGNGIRVLTLGFDVSLRDGSYSARYALRTKGLASVFSKGTTLATAKGRLDAGRPDPLEYGARIRNSNGKREITVTWPGEEALPVTRRSYSLGKRKSGSIAKALKPRTADPISAMLGTILGMDGEPCRSADEVYDGKEIFKLKYEYLGIETIPKSANGRFYGPAHKCRLTYEPVAGLSKSKRRRLEDDPIPPFTVWMAPIEASNGKGAYMLPVRATGRMKWANLEVFVRKGNISGNPLVPAPIAAN